MIIDRSQLAGLAAYFQKPGSPGLINLAAQVTARTPETGKGRQVEISGIELLLESADDLSALFSPTVNNSVNPPRLERLFAVTVMKEVFPGLFADPFRHRVHTIAGFDDFKRGTLQHGRVMEVDGVATIVSTGTEPCVWRSVRYTLPASADLVSAAWELAQARTIVKESFSYRLTLFGFAANGSPLGPIHLTNSADPTQPGEFDPTVPRKADKVGLQGVASYEVEFKAAVKRDAALYERTTTLLGDSIGTPLLRAVNLLEPVAGIYDLHSLSELLNQSAHYHLFEVAGQPLRKLMATLPVSATLVHSDNQNVAGGIYEFIEFGVVSDKFSKVEARLKADVLMRVSGQSG